MKIENNDPSQLFWDVAAWVLIFVLAVVVFGIERALRIFMEAKHG